MDLTLHDGSVASFTAAELAQTLTRLTNTSQSYCLGIQDTAHVRVGPNLLVMDVGWLVGRKLIEGYGISYESTFPFGLRFTLGTSHYTLNQALAGAGYVGEPSITDLAQVYMGMYSGAAQTYLEAGQLVKSQGVFQGAAAELKSLAAGNGITLTAGADAITIDGASTLTAALPLSIADGVISVDLSSYATDFDLSAKQDNLTVSAPLSLAGNLLTIDLSAYATASALSQATSDIAANAADIATKQPNLDAGSLVTLDVGRGPVYLESNNNDNADGAGVTLRSGQNAVNGGIFAVRSAWGASRLWVGQSLTSPGDNDFHCGFTGTAGGEATAGDYKHSLTNTSVTFGTPVTCQSDLQCVDLTANALLGGAVTQIQGEIDTRIAGKQDALATGNPNDPSHVKLLEGNAVKAVIATNGLTASNQGSYVELSGATLEGSIAGKQDALATGNPNDPSHVKLLEGNAVKAVIATNGLTASNQGSYVELSGATLEGSIASKQDALATGNPSDPSHVKLLEGNAVKAVIATNGLTASDEGSYVEISGAALETSIATKQPNLDGGSLVTLDVGRGIVFLENHYNDDADGAGVTLRTSNNPVDGSIFAVRSSGGVSRLWVGQDLTSTGDNPFYCGFTGSAGAESTAGNYKHSLTNTSVTFGTPVTCQSDLQCVDLTANALYGNAVIQIQGEIDTRIASKQDQLATGNPSDPSHVKLLEGNAVKAVIATNGLTASNQGSYVELSGATLEGSIASKQDALTAGDPTGEHEKILHNGVVRSLKIDPPSYIEAGITLSATDDAITLDYNMLSNSLTQRAWQVTLDPVLDVVTGPTENNGYHYLNTGSAGLAVRNGTVPVFNFNIDGSSVAQGNLTVLGDTSVSSNLTVSGSILNAEFQTAVAQAAAAQPGFTTVSPLSMTLDVPSGEFRLGVDLAAAAPLWDAGELTNQNTGSANANYTTSQDRKITKHAVTFTTAFTQPPIVLPNMRGNAAAHASIDRIWVEDGSVTTTGCNIVVADRSSSNSVKLTWYAMQPP